MKHYREIVVVYPQDKTTLFLDPIIEVLKNIFPKANFFCPEPDTYGNAITDDTELIIFLGHGTPSKLCGTVNEKGEKTIFLNTVNGAVQLGEATVILFACNSNEYLNKVRANSEIDFFITFGDMPTDWEHIQHHRKTTPSYLISFQEEHLEYYKLAIAESLAAGFNNGSYTNSLVGIVKGLTLVINKKINEVLLSKPWSKEEKFQMIELLNSFKKDIRYSQPL